MTKAQCRYKQGKEYVRSREMMGCDGESRHNKDAVCSPIVSNIYSLQVLGATDTSAYQPAQTSGEKFGAIVAIKSCYGGGQVEDRYLMREHGNVTHITPM